MVTAALAEAGAPDGVFGLIEGTEAGRVLIQDPAITAGAFTGSLTGGRALFDLASGRPAPVPFYAELGSINPVVVTAGCRGRRRRRAGQGSGRLLHPGRRAVLHQARGGVRARGCRFRGAGRRGHGRRQRPRRLLNQRIVKGFGQDLGQLAEHPAVEVDRRHPVGRRRGAAGADRARHLGRRGGRRSRGAAGRVLRSGDPAGALLLGG